jgi:microcystin-dependent protein
MSSPFVAEIRIVSFNFAPTGWAMCNGQLLPISQNTALFSLLGTTYGGDGRSIFGLPNFQGSFPMSWGQGAGLTNRFIGEVGGSQNVTLLQTEIPQHTHSVVPGASGAVADPSGAALGPSPSRPYAATAPGTQMSLQALAPAGSSVPHNNMPPYLVLNFIIAMQGVFPPRS